jgi:hypothetical protein
VFERPLFRPASQATFSRKGRREDGTRPNRIIIADRADGAPLGPKDGPFKLVIEGDLRPARGVRMVTSVSLIRPGQPAR